jgi:hypothetical protein
MPGAESSGPLSAAAPARWRTSLVGRGMTPGKICNGLGIVYPAPRGGWESAEHEDQRVVRQERYTDWHRVEQALTRFAREIAELLEHGWREA